MKNSYRDKKSGPSKDSKKTGEGNFWQRGTSGPGPTKVFMHKATCAECGNSCEVPFKPNGKKPILCSMCFKKDGSTDHKRSDNIRFGRTESNRYEDKKTENVSEQFRVVNAKLDAILKALR